MVTTITPVVHGRSRTRYALAVFLHVFGAGLSAGVVGAALGGLGAVAGAPWGTAGAALLALAAAAYALGETGLLRIPIPAARRQVPEWWRTFFSPVISALLYGVGLGAGLATLLSHGTFVVVCAAAFLSGHPALGLALAAPFGIARAGAAAIGGAGRAPHLVVARLDELATTRWASAANTAVLVAVAAASVIT